jgi:hypothetical protein
MPFVHGHNVLRAVTHGTCWNATKANLVQQIKFAIRLEAGVEKMWRVGESSGAAVSWVLLTEERLHNIHNSTQEMSPTAQCCRSYGSKNSASRDSDFDKIVEAIVDHSMRVIYRQ